MPIPSVIGDLSTTASSNGPAGSETPTDGDGYLRAHAGFIALLRDYLNGTTGAVGLKVANTGSADAATLDWYEEDTWTPTITFGGASVGVTYSSRSGRFTRIGDTVFYEARVTLTSKGSSTGTAYVTGLPYTVSSESAPCSMAVQGMSSSLVSIHGLAEGATTKLRIDQFVSGSNSPLTDASFTDSSGVTFAGSYKV